MFLVTRDVLGKKMITNDESRSIFLVKILPEILGL